MLKTDLFLFYSYDLFMNKLYDMKIIRHAKTCRFNTLLSAPISLN